MQICTPSEVGVSHASLKNMFRLYDKNGLNLHSVLMARHGKVFFEKYWGQFDADTPHRLYSITKSFVSVAIGCLVDEGKLDLDTPIVRFFPDKLPDAVPLYMQQQTVRHMLTMSNCTALKYWLIPECTDRIRFYFTYGVNRPAGTIFEYDTGGSYVLGCLVERLSGMTLLEYLRLKVLDKLGGFENAEMLLTNDGTPWGDSGLIATPRAMMNFGLFCLNRGKWNGEQLVSEDYMTRATTRQVDNNVTGIPHFNTHGYGYQFWMTEQGGFSCNGMGGQYMICVPDKDFVFVCTADNQLNDPLSNTVTFEALFDEVISHLKDEPLPEEGFFTVPDRDLRMPEGEKYVPFAETVNGAWFRCDENRMGITRFKLEFVADDEGVFTWFNQQGEKQLRFGLGHQVRGLFPQLGYSNDRGNVHQITDFKYKCAASAAWTEARKLVLNVWIIDRYFGRLMITFGFTNDGRAGIRMMKCAEDFLQEYEGWAAGTRENQAGI